MPVHACKQPLCPALIAKGSYCDAHQHLAPKRDDRERRRASRKFYDQYNRDPDSRRFYDSAAWARARSIKLADNPICERCGVKWSTTVHHRKPLKECQPADKLDQNNLKALCGPECHNAEEAEIATAKAAK